MASAQVTVGVAYPKTGPIVELGAYMHDAIQLAVEQVNAQGGILGQEFRLVSGDTGCDPDQSVNAVKKLAEEHKISALIGPICSGATLRQARSLSIPAEILTLSGASASPLITSLRDNDLVFRTAVSDTFKGKAMAAYIYEQGVRKISISSANDAYNSGLGKVFGEAFAALGGSISTNQVHQPDKQSYDREVAALAVDADALALFAYYGSSGNALLKSAFSTGSFTQVFAADGMLSEETIEVLGADALSDTMIFASSTDEARTGFKLWEKMASDAGIPVKGTLLANVYDSAFMMALAIEASRVVSGPEIAKGLRMISGPDGETIYPGEFAKARALIAAGKKINYDGASGPVDFDKNGDIVGFISVNRVLDGAWVSELVR